jgi:MFS family permease
LIGYVGWGITTALFPTAAYFHPIGVAVFMAILFDCIMTFFGSGANDAVFHAYVADITTVNNRGKVMGVIEILTWVSLLIVYGGAGLVIDAFGYFPFFYLVGGLVFVLGLVASLLLEEPQKPAAPPQESFFASIRNTFKWETLREQKDLLYLLVAIALWGISQQIFFPYLLIYINHFLHIETLQASLIIFLAILIGGITTAYPLGLLTDRIGRRKMALIAIIGEMIGLMAFSFSRSFPALVVSGILWLAPISAWTIAVSAWSKDLFPEDKRGQFGGYVIFSQVALTVVPGPLIGRWLTTQFGVQSILNRKQAFIPTSLIFQVTAIATLLTLLPVLKTKSHPTTLKG